MDDDRIDFSALDPKRDPARFERMVQAVVAGVRPPAPAVYPLVLQLVGWGRAAVAVAACLGVAAWLPSLARGRLSATDSPTSNGSDPVELVSAWAETGNVPSDIDLVQALGGLHDR